MTSYPITANCNFESRDDACGVAIHAAREAVESGLTDDTSLIESLDDLETVLMECADKDDVASRERCRGAECAVHACWTEETQEAVYLASQAPNRYVD